MPGDERALPYVMEAGPEGQSLIGLIERDRLGLRRTLAKYGAILFRGFAVGGIGGFQPIVEAFSGQPPLPYAERSSPRRSIQGNVYTSTDYSADEEIFLHNESSYQITWPRLLAFYCARPPETLGATPLADSRTVLRAIHPDVREDFVRRGWMVVRNFNERFGVPWQQAFGTEDRREVETYCRRHGIEVEWRDDGRLRTRAVRAAVHVHPDTGEQVWFNHATFFHHTTLPDEVREGLLAILGEDGLPTNTYFGDGGRIEAETLDHLRSCYRSNLVRFDWRQDDVLMIDNMLASHGREPFTGPRRIAVAMAENHGPAAGA